MSQLHGWTPQKALKLPVAALSSGRWRTLDPTSRAQMARSIAQPVGLQGCSLVEWACIVWGLRKAPLCYSNSTDCKFTVNVVTGAPSLRHHQSHHVRWSTSQPLQECLHLI